MRKAGYNGAITESLRKCIRLTCYQSTLFTMCYSEYVNYVYQRVLLLKSFGANPKTIDYFWKPRKTDLASVRKK